MRTIVFFIVLLSLICDTGLHYRDAALFVALFILYCLAGALAFLWHAHRIR